MSFSIRQAKERGLDLVLLEDDAAGTSIAILPHHGASLHAFRVQSADGTAFNLVDGYQDLEELEKWMALSYKGAKLSPFPCRIAGGKYLFENKEYRFDQLFPDGNAIHGLLYNKPYTITDQQVSDSVASVCLEYNYSKEDKGYPFNYSCQIRYTLATANSLELTTTITNLDKSTLPIADGWHPYFRLGGKVGDWLLQFHAEAIIEFDNALIPTGRLTQYDVFDSPRMIGDTFLDNCFALKPGIVSPACEIFNPATRLRIGFFPDPAYPYLQLYTPPSRQSIAVENLSSAPDSFNNKMGLLLIEPGHSQIFTVRYKVSVD